MFSREKDPGLGRSGRVVPRLEALEDRCCPSSVTFSNSTHILTFNGDATSSNVSFSDDGQGHVTAKLNGHAVSLPSGVVNEILVNSKAGGDTISYTSSHTLTHSEQVVVNLGTGKDQVNLDYSKGVSASSLKININGGGSNAVVNTDFGAITNTDLELTAQLGASWEQFTAAFQGNLAGKAKANVNVQGGNGIDGANVQMNGNIVSTAQMTVTEKLGTQNGTSHVSYSGKLDGKLSVNLQGGQTWSWLESHFNLTPGSTGTLIAHELGGPSSDMLILMVQNAGSHLKNLDTLINGGLGHDSAVHTAGVKVLNVP